MNQTTRQLERICQTLQLGALAAPPLRLTGGYTHRMYGVETDRGHYAVKLLNPEIMRRPDALDNYRRAESMEQQLEDAGVPILPALTIGGRRMQQVDGQYLYVFPFFEGRALKDHEITPFHCARMGEALARIHNATRRLTDEAPEPLGIDWPALASALREGGDEAYARILGEAAPMLDRVTRAAGEAAACLPAYRAVCHNDMDAKNVLWRGDEFCIIDLECIGWADPAQEMMDLAISWAGWPPQEACFKAFTGSYYAAGGYRPANAAHLMDSRRNHIDWLAYNARRALSHDPEERAEGRGQITETIDKIRADQERRSLFLRWMAEV